MTAAEASPYEALEPSVWRGLLGRAAVFWAVRARLGRLWDLADQPPIRFVLSRLEEAAWRSAAQDWDDAETVRQVVKEWQTALGSWSDVPSLDAEARTLLRDLQEMVVTACSDDPFDAVFAPIATHARELYGPQWRQPRLSVAYTRSHPRAADSHQDPYVLTALTPWPPDPAEVWLHIWYDGFGPAAYAALPMLFTHECVCHVPARQDRANNDSVFAEGFLDWAAYHFFRIWATKIDPVFAPTTRKHAERLKDVLVGQQNAAQVRVRQAGHDAAEELVCWLEAERGMTLVEANTQVARLAVELNKADGPLLDKDHLISALGMSMPPALTDLLDRWLAGEASAEELLNLRLPG